MCELGVTVVLTLECPKVADVRWGKIRQSGLCLVA